jgi:hypothetical protein
MIGHDDELVEGDAVETQRNLDPRTRDRLTDVAESNVILADRSEQTGPISRADRDEVRARGGVVVLTDAR